MTANTDEGYGKRITDPQVLKELKQGMERGGDGSELIVEEEHDISRNKKGDVQLGLSGMVYESDSCVEGLL